MPAPPTLTVPSLGGGVQSSVMALMASEGAFDRTPDCAVFADTHWEPPSVYEHIESLRDRLSFPLYVVDNGRSLREDVKALTNHSDSRTYIDIPVYLKGRHGEGDGIGRRAVHRQLQGQPHTPQDTRTAGTRAEAARPRRNHRRGHTHEDILRPLDSKPLPAH